MVNHVGIKKYSSLFPLKIIKEIDEHAKLILIAMTHYVLNFMSWQYMSYV